MHSLSALLLASAAAYAIARPLDATASTGFARLDPSQQRAAPAREFVNDYVLPGYIIPRYLGYDESPRMPLPPPPMSNNDWLNKEIDRISQMEEEDDSVNAYEGDLPTWMDRYMRPYYEGPVQEYSAYSAPVKGYSEDKRLMDQELPDAETIPIPDSQPQTMPIPDSQPQAMPIPDSQPQAMPIPDSQPQTIPILDHQLQTKRESEEEKQSSDNQRKAFALTPVDKGYYDHYVMEDSPTKTPPVTKATEKTTVFVGPPRQIRQNPNLSRTKTLVAENLDRLRAGLANKNYRLPVSLLPTNLRWLKINHLDDDDEQERSQEDDTTDKPRHIHVLETAPDPTGSIYGVAMIAAVGTALTMAIFGFAIGWYTLSKKAKAAADVDYPAYGVTGPTVDSSGDRKLAHSAHMYHYQHQKQQIIAMERNGLEQRTGSISDPESEEENEEGDYTVYECPGFATTGEMEVRNPLFTEDPTPTPGKCEITKPQPQE